MSVLKGMNIEQTCAVTSGGFVRQTEGLGSPPPPLKTAEHGSETKALSRTQYEVYSHC